MILGIHDCSEAKTVLCLLKGNIQEGIEQTLTLETHHCFCLMTHAIETSRL